MKLKLYKNFPINSYKDQIYYVNEKIRDEEFDKFEDNTLKLEEMASCDKTKQTIRLDINFFHGNKYNYGCIIESNKRYYIFVDFVEWKSNLNTCILHYSYDYWQTYAYDIIFKKSFIERKHVNDDTFGKYVMSEDLPITEYYVQENRECMFNDYYLAMTLSDTTCIFIEDTNDNIPDILTATKNQYTTATLLIEDINTTKRIINLLTEWNKVNSIINIYLLPKKTNVLTMNVDISNPEKAEMAKCKAIKQNSSEITMQTMRVSRPTSIKGYKPKNNKCFIYPFCFVNITNNLGSSLVGKFELSDSLTDIDFKFYIPIGSGNTPYGYLSNYNNVEKNLDYSLNGLTNVEIPWTSDSYAQYLSANLNKLNNSWKTIGITEKVNTLSNVINGVNSVAPMAQAISEKNVNGALSLGSDILMRGINSQININNAKNSIISSLQDSKSQADVAHGSFNSNALTLLEQNGFKLQVLTPSLEEIKTIDMVFEMYGYKVNSVEQPELNTRKYWNYLKTSDINLIGNIPNDALNVIKSMFNSGVTLWHEIDKMYDYSQNNH